MDVTDNIAEIQVSEPVGRAIPIDGSMASMHEPRSIIPQTLILDSKSEVDSDDDSDVDYDELNEEGKPKRQRVNKPPAIRKKRRCSKANDYMEIVMQNSAVDYTERKAPKVYDKFIKRAMKRREAKKNNRIDWAYVQKFVNANLYLMSKNKELTVQEINDLVENPDPMFNDPTYSKLSTERIKYRYNETIFAQQQNKKTGPWTVDEVNLLKQLWNENESTRKGTGLWQHIAEKLNRPISNCVTKWNTIKKASFKVGRFTKEEDAIIIEKVRAWHADANEGNKSKGLWSGLEEQLMRRSDVIRKRWSNVLKKQEHMQQGRVILEVKQDHIEQLRHLPLQVQQAPPHLQQNQQQMQHQHAQVMQQYPNVQQAQQGHEMEKDDSIQQDQLQAQHHQLLQQQAQQQQQMQQVLQQQAQQQQMQQVLQQRAVQHAQQIQHVPQQQMQQMQQVPQQSYTLEQQQQMHLL